MGKTLWAVRIAAGKVVGGLTSCAAGNLYFPTGNASAVGENQRRVLSTLSVADLPIVQAQQVHGSHVCRITPEMLPNLPQDESRCIAPQADGLVTTVPQIVLGTHHADCVPLFLWLPDAAGIGLAHAGWRGTLQDIAGNTVRALAEATGRPPCEIRVLIGPAICRQCYEVGPEVAEAAAKVAEAPTTLKLVDSKWHLDLKELNRQLLLQAGVHPENIISSSLCTRCRPDLFFSYRRLGPGCPEMGAFLVIRPTQYRKASRLSNFE